ncbi:MAG: hypothetical protein F6J90_34120 [Moorea sp. SIOASIH]|nr:hypothetical protein [Moorena sp. SIOASIH]
MVSSQWSVVSGQPLAFGTSTSANRCSRSVRVALKLIAYNGEHVNLVVQKY